MKFFLLTKTHGSFFSFRIIFENCLSCFAGGLSSCLTAVTISSSLSRNSSSASHVLGGGVHLSCWFSCLPQLLLLWSSAGSLARQFVLLGPPWLLAENWILDLASSCLFAWSRAWRMHGNSCLKEKTKTPFYPSQLWRARDGKYRQRGREGGSEVIYKMLNSV